MLPHKRFVGGGGTCGVKHHAGHSHPTARLFSSIITVCCINVSLQTLCEFGRLYIEMDDIIEPPPTWAPPGGGLQNRSYPPPKKIFNKMVSVILDSSQRAIVCSGICFLDWLVLIELCDALEMGCRSTGGPCLRQGGRMWRQEFSAARVHT